MFLIFLLLGVFAGLAFRIHYLKGKWRLKVCIGNDTGTY
jgi:hypothetical protein